MHTAQAAVEFEEKRIKQREKDTFAQRRREGRSVHGTTSRSALAVGVLSWVFQITAIIVPMWRSKWMGILGYATSRHWGLWSIQGYQNTMWHRLSVETCDTFGRLNILNICVSPLCRWFRLKCLTYWQLTIVCYVLGVIFVVELIVHGCCIYFTAVFTPKMIRWAQTWWPVCAVIHTICLITYFFVTEELMSEFETISYYPTPDPSVSFVLSALAGAGLMTNAYLGYLLKRWWPEEVDSDDSDSDDDSSSTRGQQRATPGNPQGTAHMQGYPQGFDQSQGYGQGFSPEQGYGWGMAQPQGYDAAQGYGQGPYPNHGMAQPQGYDPAQSYGQGPYPDHGMAQPQGYDPAQSYGQGPDGGPLHVTQQPMGAPPVHAMPPLMPQ